MRGSTSDFAWQRQTASEPRSRDCPCFLTVDDFVRSTRSQPGTVERTEKSFATDVSGLVKSIDSNHLVSLGTMGGGQCGSQSVEYQDLHSVATIDLCEYHDYHQPHDPMPGDQWNGLQVRIDSAMRSASRSSWARRESFLTRFADPAGPRRRPRCQAGVGELPAPRCGWCSHCRIASARRICRLGGDRTHLGLPEARPPGSDRQMRRSTKGHSRLTRIARVAKYQFPCKATLRRNGRHASVRA